MRRVPVPASRLHRGIPDGAVRAKAGQPVRVVHLELGVTVRAFAGFVVDRFLQVKVVVRVVTMSPCAVFLRSIHEQNIAISSGPGQKARRLGCQGRWVPSGLQLSSAPSSRGCTRSGCNLCPLASVNARRFHRTSLYRPVRSRNSRAADSVLVGWRGTAPQTHLALGQGGSWWPRYLRACVRPSPRGPCQQVRVGGHGGAGNFRFGDGLHQRIIRLVDFVVRRR